MRYAIYERRFGGRPIIVGLDPLPGIALADDLNSAWSYETATPVLIFVSPDCQGHFPLLMTRLPRHLPRIRPTRGPWSRFPPAKWMAGV
ncbi:hypothetical protein [Kyrpidia tusciae]|uniref:Uncharacterized protein n=1 Tax=Kyrpidia tusciae (strain DSM 2912 / NBRC 15312 / T2) TaxID=562970 RepID=D5WR12_KYRT2|nr:hypothetical protein [Kyrpidia tusciae]ADG04802.1 hypothetical protein Btus_0022 [Kyrpidia tusciae DSM 2912]